MLLDAVPGYPMVIDAKPSAKAFTSPLERSRTPPPPTGEPMSMETAAEVGRMVKWVAGIRFPLSGNIAPITLFAPPSKSISSETRVRSPSSN